LSHINKQPTLPRETIRATRSAVITESITILSPLDRLCNGAKTIPT
jgi:hypothetical protein